MLAKQLKQVNLDKCIWAIVFGIIIGLALSPSSCEQTKPRPIPGYTYAT